MAQNMATLTEKQANEYLNARPKYPTIWYKVLAGRTSGHKVAWDVGTGNGQAALGVAEYYEKVVATDINEKQISLAKPHSKVTYLYTPASMSDDELVDKLGGENSIDLIVAAQSLHYFDLKRFYSIVRRVLRKDGIIACWVYNDLMVTPKVDSIMKRLVDSTKPFRTPTMNLAFDGYKTIEFPFQNIRLGTQGRPKALEIPHKLSLDGYLGFFKSWQPLVMAKEKGGVDLLTTSIINGFKKAWGDQKQVKDVAYKAFMLAGKL